MWGGRTDFAKGRGVNIEFKREFASVCLAAALGTALIIAPLPRGRALAQGAIPEPIDETDEQCRLDLGCSVTMGELLANQYCTPKIKQAVDRPIEWRDGFFGTLYPRARWKNRSKGHIEFRGDGARFKNRDGSENWLQYTCVVDVQNQEYVSFEAWPGRDDIRPR